MAEVADGTSDGGYEGITSYPIPKAQQVDFPALTIVGDRLPSRPPSKLTEADAPDESAGGMPTPQPAPTPIETGAHDVEPVGYTPPPLVTADAVEYSPPPPLASDPEGGSMVVAPPPQAGQRRESTPYAGLTGGNSDGGTTGATATDAYADVLGAPGAAPVLASSPRKSKLDELRAGITSRVLARNLDELAKRGLLDAVDADGISISDRLLRLMKRGSVATDASDVKATNEKLVTEISELLVNPEDKVWQGKTAACAATAIEYLFATRSPAAFVRIVSALILDDGATLKKAGFVRDENSAPEDGSVRSNIDRLFQASLMRTVYSHSLGEPGTYENSDQKTRQERGMTKEEFKTAMSVIFGSGNATGSNASFPIAAVDQRTPMIVAVDWMVRDTADPYLDGHALIVTEFKDGSAVFVDPGNTRLPGTVMSPKLSSRLDGPEREAVDGGKWKIPVKNLEALIRYWGPVGGYEGRAGGH